MYLPGRAPCPLSSPGKLQQHHGWGPRGLGVRTLGWEMSQVDDANSGVSVSKVGVAHDAIAFTGFIFHREHKTGQEQEICFRFALLILSELSSF